MKSRVVNAAVTLLIIAFILILFVLFLGGSFDPVKVVTDTSQEEGMSGYKIFIGLLFVAIPLLLVFSAMLAVKSFSSLRNTPRSKKTIAMIVLLIDVVLLAFLVGGFVLKELFFQLI